ncbi:MAG: TonB-dependent receptor [Terracidiphilus sp.]
MQRFKTIITLASVLLMVLALSSVSSPAQTFRGSINGTVTDSSGAVIPGAKITATDTATAAVHETVSSGAGEFSFNDLPQSTYTVKVAAAGFSTIEATGVQVKAGAIYTLPVKLTVAQQATTVEVAADSLSLDTTTVVQTTVIDGQSLQDVPLNGRDFTQLQGSSVAFTGYNNSGSVNGTRGNQLNYTIDGTDNNDLYLNAVAVNQGSISGIAGVVYPVEALDEYSLQTTGNSESGRSPGGNLNISTKSGSNSFHGDVYYYNRNEALAVASPFATPGNPELPLRNQNYGVSLGGPIRRDHDFFFLTYEEQKYLIGLSNSATEPSSAYVTDALAVLANANGAYNWTDSNDVVHTWSNVPVSQVSQNILNTLWDPALIGGLKDAPSNYASNEPEAGYSHNLVVHVDHNFSDKSHLSGIWYWGQGYANGYAGSLLNEYFQVVPSHNENYNVTWNYNLRPNLTNQVAAGANFFTQGFADENHTQVLQTLAALNTGSALTGSPDIQINGFDQIGVTPQSGRNDIMAQVSDIVTWTIGKHQIRTGIDYRRAYIDLYYNFGGRGTFGFGTGGLLGPWSGSSVSDSNVLNLAEFMAGYAFHPSITLGTQERFIYAHTGSAFAQDTWQLTPKFNVNLGLRYDYQQPFYTNPPNSSIFDPNNGGLLVAGTSGAPGYIYNTNKLNLSPRVGLSYQAFSGTVVRANYGIFFDQSAGQAFYGNLGVGNGGANGVNNNPAGSQPNYSIILGAYDQTTGPVWTPNQTPPIFTPALGEPTGSNVVSVYSVDRNFKTPYTELFGLNIEQSLGHSWIFNVGYVGSTSRHNLVLEDVNRSAVVAGLQLDQVTSPTTAPNGTTYGPVTIGNNTFSAQQASRPYFANFPNIGIVNQVNTTSSSSFNALQVTLRSAAWHGLSSQFGYAWSHNLDNASGFYTAPQNSFNLKGDYGNAQQDIRNHFSSYLNYAIPSLKAGPKILTAGWEVNSILKFQGGEPINVVSGADNSGTAEYQDRASITGPAINSDHSIQGHSYAQYLTPYNPNGTTGFQVPGPGTYGNLGRNQVYGPGFEDVDMSLLKNIPLYKERVHAQLRVEMFNVFNRVNLAQPLNNLGYGTAFGWSTETIGGSYGAPGIGSGEPYNTQLALKILF